MTLITQDFAVTPRGVDIDLRPLDTIIAATETTFVAAGDHLDRAVAILRGLQGLFMRLESGLGPDSGRALAGTADALQADAENLAASVTTFVGRTDGLGVAILRMNRDITDLDRVVRTIVTLSITARVIGHAMSPPQAKVASFVENLSRMAVEAEDVLTGVKQATADIRADMTELTETVERLHGTLTRDVFAALRRIHQAGQSIQDNREALLAANLVFAGQMDRTFAEVSRLIMALQVGDSVRQRFGRIRVTMDRCRNMPDAPSLALGLELSLALTDGARAEVTSEMTSAVSALSDISVSSGQALHTAREFYVGGNRGPAGVDIATEATALTAHLKEVEVLLAALRLRTEHVVERLQHILGQERTLRQIAQKVRLAGVNAVVICTHLGRQGNALREVAQWLRGLTDEADEITGQLQGSLDESRALIAEVGTASVEELSGGTQRVVQSGSDMKQRIQDIRSLVAEAGAEISRISVSLPGQIDPARRGLSDYVGRLSSLDGTLRTIRLQRTMLPPPDLPLYVGSDIEAIMAELRRGYTMEAERRIHDALIGNEVAPVAVEAPAAASADLDDILF